MSVTLNLIHAKREEVVAAKMQLHSLEDEVAQLEEYYLGYTAQFKPGQLVVAKDRRGAEQIMVVDHAYLGFDDAPCYELYRMKADGTPAKIGSVYRHESQIRMCTVEEARIARS